MRLIERKFGFLLSGLLPVLAAGFLLAPAPVWAQSADEPAVKVSTNDAQGKYLTDAEGRTLYLFGADSRGVSKCYDFCANTFPAYTIEGRPVAGDGVVSSLLGTLKRKSGDTQITYAGHPLYYYLGDMHPGSTAADGAKKYGAEWSAIAPDGEAAEATAVATAEAGGTEAQGATAKGTAQTAADKGGNPFAGDPQAIAAGKKLYSTFGCYGCHGRGGGGGMGPSLIDGEWSYGGGTDAAVFKSIAEGRPKGMPAWGSHFTEEQIWKIVAFLRSISNVPAPGEK